MDIGKPAFVPALDLEMGFEKIVRIAHARGGKFPYLETSGGCVIHLLFSWALRVMSYF